MKRRRPPTDPESSQSAYLRALRWLTARELSEGQTRARLADFGYSDAAIQHAIERLREDRALDDRRVALSVARTSARIRRHGPRRVLARLLSMQIDRDLARESVREVFGDDEPALVESALERRLRGHDERLADPAERRKLVAYLVRQGFTAAEAAAAIRARARARSR